MPNLSNLAGHTNSSSSLDGPPVRRELSAAERATAPASAPAVVATWTATDDDIVPARGRTRR